MDLPLVLFEFVASVEPPLLMTIILSELQKLELSRKVGCFSLRIMMMTTWGGFVSGLLHYPIDKSTCQSNNRGIGIFGYPGTPNIDVTLLLEGIVAEYGVFIGVIVQPAHRFDLNACDALYHSVMKRRVRQYPFPLCQKHILRDYASAVQEVSTDRVIQRSFWRAHWRNEKDDIDHSLIQTDILEW